MAATFAFEEDNGVATGTPARGTTAGTAVTTTNWKNVDDATTTAYTAAPVTAGNNSYEKFQYGAFSGTYNQISAVLWAHTAGTPGAGLTLKGVATSTYTTPATVANSALTTDMTTAIAIASGQAVLLSTTSSPATATPTASTTVNPVATQYIVSQLQTTTSAAPGDTATLTLTMQYNEN